MAIVITAFATALTVLWIVLLGRATLDDWITSAYSKVFNNTRAVSKLRAKETDKREKLSRYHGIASISYRLFSGFDPQKKIRKLEQVSERLQDGDLRKLSVFGIPGYVLQREFDVIGKGGIHKMIMEKSLELYGKKHAVKMTKHMLAKMLSYPMIGIAITLLVGAPVLAMGNKSTGAVLIVIGTVLVLVMTYAMYDEMSDLVKKRRKAICKQFPNVVSKLALLVTSGMIMDRAWKVTAYSQESELYQEMRKTADELDNLVSPEAAYAGFISRCNTKETAKLASAIMQNLTKGNAEIGRLLKDMAREAWQERRHMAKRDAEKANSRLMIPTMLLFVAILVMLMVPIAMNFTGL